MPLRSLLILLYTLGLTVERGVWSYTVWFLCAPSVPSILPYSIVLMIEGRYRGAPSLPLDTAVFVLFYGAVEGMALRGLVLLYRPPLLTPLEPQSRFGDKLLKV